MKERKEEKERGLGVQTMDIGPLSHVPPIGPPNLPLVALLNSSMAPSQPSNGIYLILRESQSQGAQNTALLTSLLSSFPLAHLHCLPHLAPSYSWQRPRHTPASGPLHFLCVCQKSSPPKHLRSLLKSDLPNGPFLATLA